MESDIECAIWDPHYASRFMVSTESGLVKYIVRYFLISRTLRLIPSYSHLMLILHQCLLSTFVLLSQIVLLLGLLINKLKYGKLKTTNHDVF